MLHREIALLEAARKQLHGEHSGPAKPTVSRPPTVRRARRVRPRRSREVVSAAKLEAILAQHDGITTSELAKLTNGRTDQVLALLREMESTGRARRSGERRGTRWHAITDEDRIRARAAELERQSKGARRARSS